MDTHDRLKAVLSHWAPRILVSGITYSDADRVVQSCKDWSEWCLRWSNEAQRQEEMGDAALEVDRQLTAGTYFSRAALFYHFAQFMFFDDLNQKRKAAREKVRVYQRAAPLLLPFGEAVKVTFRDGTLKGYLRLAPQRSGRAVIIIPGSDSTKEEFGTLETYFLERGIATLSLDGPGQGEGREFGLLRPDSWDVVLDSAQRFLSERGYSSIGVYGMAFGGHLVLQGAGQVPGIKAIVNMNGFGDLGRFWESLPEVYRANMGYTLGGSNLDQTEAVARQFALRKEALPECPVLIMHGGRDRIFPPSEADLVAEQLGSQAEAVVFEDGNHVCNNIPYKYRSLAADWLREKLS